MEKGYSKVMEAAAATVDTLMVVRACKQARIPCHREALRLLHDVGVMEPMRIADIFGWSTYCWIRENTKYAAAGAAEEKR